MKKTQIILAFFMTFAAVMMLFEGVHQSVIAAEDEYIDLPMPREFTPALMPDGSPQYITGQAIEADIKKFSPGLKKFYYNKNIKKFIVPEGAWLKNLLDAYGALLSEVGIQGKADTWDCENYSGLLNSLTTLRIWRAGYLDTRAALGWLRVDAKKEWAGLPGVMHALMFTVTAKGIFIIEPQNGQYTSLSEYPNNQDILEVYLF